MTVSVLVPWAPGCAYREAAWEWVQGRYADSHPEWEIVTGSSTSDEFSRSQAILDAANRSSGDILVVADADAWCDPQPAIAHADRLGWAIPHHLVHRLSASSSDLVRKGANWRGLPLSQDNEQDASPYKGSETGTLVVLRRDVLFEAPPDPRFVGWGQEDQAWSLTLSALVGRPWRGTDDLVHIWHPAQPRRDRQIGSQAGIELYGRYRKAKKDPAALRALIDEWRRA